MSLFDSARFQISAAKLSGLPTELEPEIAFAGRSNAGKSTTINVLTRQTRLAFASKTPGRTQLVNFFELRGLVIVMDSRRPFMPTDEWLIEFMKQRPEVKMLWLLNKCDQIKTQERRTTLRAVEKRAAEFGDRVTVQFFSGLKREGVDELAKTLETWLNPATTAMPLTPAAAKQ